jgi:hypothetical protein
VPNLIYYVYTGKNIVYVEFGTIPQFQASTGVLGTYLTQIRGDYYNKIMHSNKDN